MKWVNAICFRFMAQLLLGLFVLLLYGLTSFNTVFAESYRYTSSGTSIWVKSDSGAIFRQTSHKNSDPFMFVRKNESQGINHSLQIDTNDYSKGTLRRGFGSDEEIQIADKHLFEKHLKDTGRDPKAPPQSQNKETPTQKPTEPECDSGAFTWVICAGINLLDGAITGVQEIAEKFLKVDPINPLDTNSDLYKLWSSFKNVANVLFVLVFVIIIFANTLSINLNAYTVKKMLPRLVAASILVQFSYIISALLVDIGNVLGFGIGSLIDLVLADAEYNFEGNSQKVVGNTLLPLGFLAGVIAGSAALITAVLSGTAFLTLIAAFFGLLTLFIVLLFRQILINMLIVLSPIAFVAWVLPNTDKYFDLWFKNLIRALLMFPLIILLIGAGKVFSVAAAANDSAFAPIIAMAALVAPLFFSATVLKMSGSAMMAGSSAISKLGKGVNSWAGNTDSMKRAQERAQARKTALRAGQSVRIGGQKLGFSAGGGSGITRLSRGMGSGFSTSPAANARALAAFNQSAAAAGKRMQEEGMTLEAHKYLSRGDEWYGNEIKRLTDKRDAATDPSQKAIHQSAIDRLSQGKDMASRFKNSSEHRVASMQYLASQGQLDDTDREQLSSYMGSTAVGQSITNQVWSNARRSMKDSRPDMLFTDAAGNVDKDGLLKYVSSRNQSTMANWSLSTFEKLKDEGILEGMAADPQKRQVLESLMSDKAGPSAGAGQQKLISEAISAHLNPSQQVHSSLADHFDADTHREAATQYRTNESYRAHVNAAIQTGSAVPPPPIPVRVTESILKSSGGDIDVALHMENEYRNNQAFKTSVDQSVIKGEAIAGAPGPHPDPGMSSVSEAISKEMIKAAKNDLHSLRKMRESYSTNPVYKSQVEQAILDGRSIPPPA